MVHAGLATILDWLPPLLILLGVIVLAILVTIGIRSHMALHSSSPPAADERLARDIEAMRDELVETVRTLAAQVESRARELESLLNEADDRLAMLNDSLGEVPSPSKPSTPPSPAGAAPAKGSGGATGSDPLRAAVYELADAGLSPLQIARRLNEQVGKVELILALRPTV